MGFSLLDDSLGLRAGGIGPREQSRQATHLALTLELLLLLEGQGAGEHRAGVVEAVLDHVLVLVCEPARVGWWGSPQSDRPQTALPTPPHLRPSRKPTQKPTSSPHPPLLGPLTTQAAWASFHLRVGVLWARRGARGPPGTPSPADVLTMMTDNCIRAVHMQLLTLLIPKLPCETVPCDCLIEKYE